MKLNAQVTFHETQVSHVKFVLQLFLELGDLRFNSPGDK
jgi:hypothetical protein